MLKILAAWLFVFVIGSVPCSAKGKAPLKVVAPDLIVESLEFGKFPAGQGPHDVSPEKVKFIPVASKVANQTGYVYGYRIMVHTKRNKVRMYRTFNTPRPRDPKKGEGFEVRPINGAIYEDWLLDGFKNGTYWVKVWIEDSELPKLTYVVKY